MTPRPRTRAAQVGPPGEKAGERRWPLLIDQSATEALRFSLALDPEARHAADKRADGAEMIENRQ